MAKYEDYVRQAGGIENEIADASNQQQKRERDPDNGQFVSSTPEVDWEVRYKELEKLNSRQAQTLGEYRKTIDEFIASPTPADKADTPAEAPSPITVDDLYDDPNAAVLRAVESHPEIRKAREMNERMQQKEKEDALSAFTSRHADYQDIAASPEFQNWVVENPTRTELFQRGNSYDFSAADALFSLYKAEQGLNQVSSAEAISQAELVSSSASDLPPDQPKYSRSEYINNLKRAKQGDLDAEDWVRTHAAGYRNALSTGNVRD